MVQLLAQQVNAYLVKKLIQDLGVDCGGPTTVLLRGSSVVGSDDGSTIMLLPGDTPVDITASGVNGLDTGSEAPNAWYAIFMIRNPDTEQVAGLLSLSPTAPTMPSGFTQKRLIGFVRNDVSSNFMWFRQKDRVVQYYSPPLLYNGVKLAGNIAVGIGALAPFPYSKLLEVCPYTLYNTSPADTGFDISYSSGASGRHYVDVDGGMPFPAAGIWGTGGSYPTYTDDSGQVFLNSGQLLAGCVCSVIGFTLTGI